MTEPRGPHAPVRAAVAAGALLTDHVGRVMLVRPGYENPWDLPGGYVEPGETPREACAREIAEELGLRIHVGPLLVTDWAPHPEEGDKILFVFDGGQLDPSRHANVRLRSDQLAEYRYVTPADVETLTVPRLARRLTAALEAHRTGATRYLEHGR